MKIIAIILSFILCCCTNETTSQNQSKKSFLNHNSELKLTGKSRGYFQIEMNETLTDDDSLKLKATVKASQSFENVTIEWKLPDSVDILSEDPWRQLNFLEGDSKTFSIEISQKNLKKEDLIFFYVYTIKNEERHGSSFTYSHGNALNSEINSSSIKTLKLKKKSKFLE